MASGELGRRRRASRELKWVGAYSEARDPTLPGPNARRSLCSGCWLRRTFPDYRCRVPQLFANAKEHSSVCSLQAGISLCHFLQQLWSKCPGAPLRRPNPRCGTSSLPRFLTEILQCLHLPPCQCCPLWPPLGPSRRSVGVVDASNRSRRNLSDT